MEAVRGAVERVEGIDRRALTRARDLFWRSPDTTPDRFVYEVERLLEFGRSERQESEMGWFLNAGFILVTLCFVIGLSR